MDGDERIGSQRRGEREELRRVRLRVMRPSRRRPSEELERCCVVPALIAIVRRVCGGVGMIVGCT